MHVKVLYHVTLEWRGVPVPVLDHQNEFLFNFRYVRPLVPGEDDDWSSQAVCAHGPLVRVVPMGSPGLGFISAEIKRGEKH